MRRIPTGAIWLVVPILLSLATVVTAAQGTLTSVERFSWWQDLRVALGANLTHNTATSFPLARDLNSIILFVLIGLTIVCLHYQLRILDNHFIQIRDSGETWRWKNADKPHSKLVTWALSGVHSNGKRIGSKKAFRLLLTYHSLPRPGRDGLMVLLAIVISIGISIYEKYVHIFAPFAPAGSNARWADSAYDNWWASWHHPAGAMVYVFVIAVGVYTVIAQNVMSITLIKVLILFHTFAEFDVDWLNVDGSYGWSAVRVFFRSVYGSILLRAAEFTIAVLVLDVRNYFFVGLIATLWSAFIVVYVVLPQTIFKNKFEAVRHERLARLVAQFHACALDASRPSSDTECYLREIVRVRTARINPLSMAKWESSGFSIVVLLPVLLTIAQIAVAV